MAGIDEGRRAGQGITEYVCLVAIVAAALLATMIYCKRGIAGRLRTAADSLGEQYSPRHTRTDPRTPVTLTVTGTTTTAANLQQQTVDLDKDGQPDDLDGDGAADQVSVMITTTTSEGETTHREGTEMLDPLASESLW